jgi:hypothetical protein
MPHLTLLFSTRNNPGSALIRAYTWSHWSHVAVVDYSRGTVIESVMIHGVREIPLDEAMNNAATFELANIRCRNPVAAINLIRSQLDKNYDYTALFGELLHRDWQDETKWFCSELITWGIETSGTRLFRAESIHRVTQQDLYARSF